MPIQNPDKVERQRAGGGAARRWGQGGGRPADRTRPGTAPQPDRLTTQAGLSHRINALRPSFQRNPSNAPRWRRPDRQKTALPPLLDQLTPPAQAARKTAKTLRRPRPPGTATSPIRRAAPISTRQKMPDRRAGSSLEPHGTTNRTTNQLTYNDIVSWFHGSNANPSHIRARLRTYVCTRITRGSAVEPLEPRELSNDLSVLPVPTPVPSGSVWNRPPRPAVRSAMGCASLRSPAGRGQQQTEARPHSRAR